MICSKCFDDHHDHKKRIFHIDHFDKKLTQNIHELTTIGDTLKRDMQESHQLQK